MGFPRGSAGEESTCNAGRPRFDPWVGKVPWRRKWQPTPVFLPGESHGQRNLTDYSPWGHKELDTTERLTLSLSLPGAKHHAKPWDEENLAVLGSSNP